MHTKPIEGRVVEFRRDSISVVEFRLFCCSQNLLTSKFDHKTKHLDPVPKIQNTILVSMTAYYRIPSNFYHHEVHPWLQEMMHEDFFSAEGSRRFHHANHGTCHRGGHEGCKFLLLLKKVAFIVLSLFFVSTIVRFALFFLAVLFSPPMILLFLAVAFLPTLSTACPHFARRSSNFNNTNGRAWNFQHSQRPSQSNGNAAVCDARANRISFRRVERETNAATQAATITEKDSGHNDGDKNNKQDQTENADFKSNNSSPPTVQHRQTVTVHRNQTEESLTLSLDVPGFGSDNIQIRVIMKESKGGKIGQDKMPVLEVHGERQNRLGETFVVHEQFIVPKDTYEVDNGISANLVDGVLEINVTKKPVVQPRMIPISHEKKET